MAHDHSGLTDAEAAETARDPYSESPKYAWITAVVIGAWIAAFALARLSYAVRERHPGIFAWSYPRKKTALWRYLSTKQQRIKAGRVFHFPVLGTGLIMLAFFLFMFGKPDFVSAVLPEYAYTDNRNTPAYMPAVWTWSIRPYYYSHWYISSPPLAIRTGFMACKFAPTDLAGKHMVQLPNYRL